MGGDEAGSGDERAFSGAAAGKTQDAVAYLVPDRVLFGSNDAAYTQHGLFCGTDGALEIYPVHGTGRLGRVVRSAKRSVRDEESDRGAVLARNTGIAKSGSATPEAMTRSWPGPCPYGASGHYFFKYPLTA